jgi:WhiB family transcriptional regulator, redox-sensing transcriptional regulator
MGHWRDHAACRGLDPTIFYPDDEDDVADAMAVCGGCPVREVCLEHAIVGRETAGVWGGATDRERRRIVRRRRRTA